VTKIPKTPKPKAKKTKAIEKYPKSKTLSAIKGSGGIMSTVAKRLDCDWHTAEAQVKRWPEALLAMQDEREGILDMSEATIFSAVKNGDVGAARYILSTVGKRRGYSEKQEVEVSNPNGSPFELIVRYVE
jgi:hypothetical protein